MDLEQRVRKTVVVRKLPSVEVVEQIARGSKFVVVDDDLDPALVPQGYSLIDMRHKGSSFKALVPQQLLFYMANPGDGELDDALESIADFYGEAEQFEDEMIQNGATSVQESNWATMARSTYRTYLINKLVVGKKDGENGEDGNDGGVVPEVDNEVLHQLDLDDPYVEQRVRLIAGFALGKSIAELEKYDIKDLLEHYGIHSNVTEKIGNEEFRRITKMRYKSGWDAHTKTMRCLADSHYDLKPEYINDPVWDYDLSTMTKTARPLSGLKDVKIAELEKEIEKHRMQKHGRIGRHDAALIRMYANLAYIAGQNPKAQLDITPPMEFKEGDEYGETGKTEENNQK